MVYQLVKSTMNEQKALFKKRKDLFKPYKLHAEPSLRVSDNK